MYKEILEYKNDNGSTYELVKIVDKLLKMCSDENMNITYESLLIASIAAALNKEDLTSEKRNEYCLVWVGGINKIFENESITLTNSCIYALVGVNGIGKSTFLNSIIQPSTLDKGSVKIDDIPSTDFTAKYHYAFVPDTKDMFLNLTGKEYLQFVSELYNQKEKFDELLAIYIPKLKLENSLEQTISSYSLGMKQKIYLAGAFMSNAQNIILDEPFNAIDPESTSVIKKILFDLKDTGKMILFSVHNLDLVSNFCDKIIFIDNRHSIFECNNPQNFDVLEKIFFDKCVIKK